jgi:hypothetical protein
MKKLQRGNLIDESQKLWNQGISNSINGYLDMGNSLKIIKDNDLWVGHFKTFDEFVEKDRHISRAQGARLIQITKYEPLLKSIPIEISKLTLMLPYLDAKPAEEQEEALHMAANCSVEALKNNLKESKGQIATDNCLHDCDWIKLFKCSKCGKVIKDA